METASSAGLEVYNHETDRRALRALFDATGGAGWRNKNGWEDNSDDLAAWYGVSVKTSSGRVCAVIMGGNKLNGALPSEIWDLTELEQLDFGDNHLQGDLPPIPENRMEKLYLFNLGTNKLTGNLPDLHLLPSLEETYLDKNRFTGSLSENIGRCEKLRMLFLFSNQLEGNLPSSLGKLVKLKKLNISDNGFSGVIPEECVHMAELRQFKVDFITDLTKPGNARVRNAFNQWVRERKLEDDLAKLSFASINVENAGDEGKAEAFPGKDDQGMLVEGPLKTRDNDCLGFEDYADVLANRLQDPAAWPVGLGIYAQWGAGKSSLCEMIIQKLETSPEESAQDPWFVRWLWRTTGGAVLYGLAAGFVAAVSRIYRPPASSTENDETNGGERKRCPRYPTFGRFRGSSVRDVDVDSAERGVEPSVSSNPAFPTVTTIVASFNAWLFADSNVLWAVLVSKIFEEVEEHFGKGAVRATRVQHAVSSSTCMDWCTAVSTTIIVMCIASATVWVEKQIEHLEEQAERAAAGVALAGVLLAFVLLVIKALPVVFKSQGQVILSKAEAMGESVGAAHLGFMAQVHEEIQVLLGMLKSKSSKDVKYLLVVSIDNLDRCPHRQIIRVLEAVHLLLEHNEVNVAVILALDPRLIIAAIEKDMGDRMCREVSGSEYLDKIIHWPFCIPGGTKQERTSLLHNWLRNQELRRRPSHQMSPDQDERGSNATEESTCVDARPQSPHGRRGRLSIAPGDEGDTKVGEESAYEDRESHFPPERRGSSSISSGDDDDLDHAAEALKRLSHFPGVAASVYEQGSHNDIPSPTTTGTWTPLPLDRQISYGAQTSTEVTELERMITKAATTPRKAKRVCNIYSIQRELAIRRANKMRRDFTNDDALKLLRWTIMSEFWPFYTACLAAIIPREESDRDQRKHTTLQTLFNVEGGEFLEKIFGGKRSSGNATGEAGDKSSTDFDSSSRITARRLIGMDEEYEGFSQLLGSHPKLAVADFEEDKLGLLRLSINLNPAMVARVTTWSRSKYEFNG